VHATGVVVAVVFVKQHFVLKSCL